MIIRPGEFESRGPAQKRRPSGLGVIWIGIAIAAVIVGLLLAILPAPARAETSGSVVYTPIELQLVQLINDYRTHKGVPALLVSDILSDSSGKHNLDMGKYGFWGHISLESDYFKPGALPGDRMVACGYPDSASWGENVATGFPSAEEAFNAWVNSPTHNQCMLSPIWKVIGVSVDTITNSVEGTYFTTDFGDYVDATAHVPGGSAPRDTTNPVAWFTTPADGAEVSGRVAITVAGSDNLGVSRLEVYADGRLLGTGGSSSYSCTWETSGMSPGTRGLEARAYDLAGNVGLATITVYVMPDPTTTTTTITTTPTTTVGTPTFADVKPDNVFYHEISDLAAAGVVAGYPDGLFHPNYPVTRAQFAKIIVLSLGIHDPEADRLLPATFVDVPRTGAEYPFDFVAEAVAHGIVSGYDDGTFGPANKVTRAQLALMLVRAGGDKLSTPPASYDARFTDVPPFARDAVRIARYNGLLSGKTDTLFSPYGTATRAHVAKMVYRLMQVLAR